MKKHNILVIDDDIELCELLAEYLATEGYSIYSVHDGVKGAEIVLKENFDLIILDVMLPGMGGFDVLKTIRHEKTTPILMLTAKGDDIDKILGLEMGADDYLPKPYNPRELLARIKAILRRTNAKSSVNDSNGENFSIGELFLNKGKFTASFSGRPLGLTVVEFNILEMLADSFGKVVSRDDIAREVLGRELASFDRSIDVHVSNIRKKIGNAEVIKSIRGAGYQLILEEN